MNELSLLSAVILLVVSIVAAFIGTNTGGGALITTATLVLLGASPEIAIATAKLGSFGTMLFGWLRFHQNQYVIYRVGLPAAVCAGIGAVFGAIGLVNYALPGLDRLLGIGMIILLILMWLHSTGLHTRVPQTRLALLIGYGLFFMLGVWGGFLPGQGILSMYILLFCFGQRMLDAAGTHKMVGLSIAIVALSIYIVAGFVAWKPGLILLVGMSIGSYFGAAYGVKCGDKRIRQLFMLVVALLAGWLLLAG